VAVAALAGLRDDIGRLPFSGFLAFRHCAERRNGAVYLLMGWFAKSSRASRGKRRQTNVSSRIGVFTMIVVTSASE
jgi:hypothetical protein